jgi:hypothetical protein
MVGEPEVWIESNQSSNTWALRRGSVEKYPNAEGANEVWALAKGYDDKYTAYSKQIPRYAVTQE